MIVDVMRDENYDVIIIGSGLGGLTAATILSQKGFKTLVVESLSRLGGRFSTIEHEGFKIPTGAILIPDGWVTKFFKEKGYLELVKDLPSPNIHTPKFITKDQKHYFYVTCLGDIYYLNIDFHKNNRTGSCKFLENGYCHNLEHEAIKITERDHPAAVKVMREFQYFLSPNSIKFIKDKE